ASQPVRIKAIADTHQIPQRFLVQILLQLKTAGLVKSIRGASGGYTLARKPENINIAEVIRAVDDRALAAPEATNFQTASSIVNALSETWKQVYTEQLRILEKLSLAEILRRAYSENVSSYQI
ncbi:Rrf2 family transcriptional regulator, partial [bacterium]|nr:Rrf2 family transcriptional regulator [bacterium]